MCRFLFVSSMRLKETPPTMAIATAIAVAKGSDIAIILVTLTSARVCDVNDSVRVYSKEGLAWHEAPASGSTPASPVRTDK